jgi:hypothetical protein
MAPKDNRKIELEMQKPSFQVLPLSLQMKIKEQIRIGNVKTYQEFIDRFHYVGKKEK